MVRMASTLTLKSTSAGTLDRRPKLGAGPDAVGPPEALDEPQTEANRRMYLRRLE